jgi:hypothetical protein
VRCGFGAVGVATNVAAMLCCAVLLREATSLDLSLHVSQHSICHARMHARTAKLTLRVTPLKRRMCLASCCVWRSCCRRTHAVMLACAFCCVLCCRQCCCSHTRNSRCLGAHTHTVIHDDDQRFLPLRVLRLLSCNLPVLHPTAHIAWLGWAAEYGAAMHARMHVCTLMRFIDKPFCGGGVFMRVAGLCVRRQGAPCGLSRGGLKRNPPPALPPPPPPPPVAQQQPRLFDHRVCMFT